MISTQSDVKKHWTHTEHGICSSCNNKVVFVVDNESDESFCTECKSKRNLK